MSHPNNPKLDPSVADHGNHHATMHSNYSPSKETHSSLSPKSPSRSASANANVDDSADDGDSGFTLMHPAFQRHTPKRSQEMANQSIYSQSISSGDPHHMHAAQDLTTSVTCNGPFAGHHSVPGQQQQARSASSTPDNSTSGELDLTAYRSKKKVDEITNNNQC